MTPPENVTAAGFICYGPLAVRYTDIPHDGSKMTLWVPQVGDLLLKLTTDSSTEVPWDHGQIFIGPNVDGTTTPPTNVIGDPVTFSVNGTPDSLWSNADIAWDANYYDSSGVKKVTTAYVFHNSDPVQIQLAQVGENPDPTQGYIEIYAIVLRAAVPR